MASPRSRTGAIDISLGTLGRMVLLVFILVVLYFILKRAIFGADALYECPYECLSSCPDGYTDYPAGNSYCKEKFEGTRGGQIRCCQAEAVAGQVVIPGDVRFYYNGDTSRQLPHEARVELRSGGDGVKGEFSFGLGNSGTDRKCYWRVGVDGGETYDTSLRNVKDDKVFSTLFETYKQKSDEKIDVARLEECKKFTGTSELVLPLASDYLRYHGRTFSFSVVMIGEESSCQANSGLDINLCDSFTHTINVVYVPERNPAIALEVNDKVVNPSTMVDLDPGKEYEFEFFYTQPYQQCSMKFLIPTANGDQTYTAVQSSLPDSLIKLFGILSAEENEVMQDGSADCLSEDPYRHRFIFTVPDAVPRGIPFTIDLRTIQDSGKPSERAFTQSYSLQTTPESRLKVQGMTPFLTREKQLDFTCTGVACTGFSVAFLERPFTCSGELTEWEDTNLTPQSNSVRYVLKDEEQNGKYLCVKAETTSGPVYALAFWEGKPAEIALDTKPPLLDVDFKTFSQLVRLSCEDDAEGYTAAAAAKFVSGCADRPYTIAYVTNPLYFITSVVSGGQLASNWRGCPDPHTGSWASWPSQTNEFPYTSVDISVLCVKAEDRAGNAAVESTLLFSSQQLLAEAIAEATT